MLIRYSFVSPADISSSGLRSRNQLFAAAQYADGAPDLSAWHSTSHSLDLWHLQNHQVSHALVPLLMSMYHQAHNQRISGKGPGLDGTPGWPASCMTHARIMDSISRSVSCAMKLFCANMQARPCTTSAACVLLWYGFAPPVCRLDLLQRTRPTCIGLCRSPVLVKCRSIACADIAWATADARQLRHGR